MPLWMRAGRGYNTSMFQDVWNALVAAIENSSSKVAIVYKGDREILEKYPAAVVVPSANENDYEDTAANRMTFSFTVRLYYPLEGGTEANYEEADDGLGDALDELLNIFLDDKVLGTAADWVIPVPSTWGYEQRGEGILRVAELTVRCRKVVAK